MAVRTNPQQQEGVTETIEIDQTMYDALLNKPFQSGKLTNFFNHWQFWNIVKAGRVRKYLRTVKQEAKKKPKQQRKFRLAKLKDFEAAAVAGQ